MRTEYLLKYDYCQRPIRLETSVLGHEDRLFSCFSSRLCFYWVVIDQERPSFATTGWSFHTARLFVLPPHLPFPLIPPIHNGSRQTRPLARGYHLQTLVGSARCLKMCYASCNHRMRASFYHREIVHIYYMNELSTCKKYAIELIPSNQVKNRSTTRAYRYFI